MFSKYLWDNYLNSGGKETVRIFEDTLTGKSENEYIPMIRRLHQAYCPAESITDGLCEDLEHVFLEPFYLKDGTYSIESGIDELLNALLDEDEQLGEQTYKLALLFITSLSTDLACNLPELFVPYYFSYNFNIIEKIFDEFEIDLPEIPVKSDYRGRVYYYGELCAALMEFREDNELSPFELCAFLYDFAPKCLGGIDYIIPFDQLPEPKAAYFIGSSPKDTLYSSKTDWITPWQTNPEARAGDMNVMYLTSPVSAIDSVWRCVSVGFNDPFFYYYRCAYIGCPKSIPRTSLKEMKKDPVLGDLPIVRKNMQGVNGVELLPSAYNYIVKKAKQKLPLLDYYHSPENPSINREKDVEDQLVNPFLEKLGYNEDDYQRQLSLKVGNHNLLLIPDYVLLPTIKRSRITAAGVVETKITIGSQKKLEETKSQARSYARQLCASFIIIASIEGIWLFEQSDDFEACVFQSTWEELKNADQFYALQKLAGRK